jgi:anti-sigma regulatory factor (Ser/Thr protein kinase)
MDGTALISIPIRDQSQIAAARRRALQIAASAGFRELDCGRLALVVTEAGTNVLRHGGGGEIMLNAESAGRDGCIDVIALDSGPGMTNIQDCLRDGVSTGGSPGTGLGAMQRLSDHFDIYSRVGQGTAIRCCVRTPGYHPPALVPGIELGAICLPRADQAVGGDAWAVRATERGALLLLLCDGLGHGVGAAQAADAARQAFMRSTAKQPVPLFDDLHRGLAGTRGAAITVVRIEPERHIVRLCGVGNLSGFLRWHNGQQRTLSQNGIGGHNIPRVKEFDHAYEGDLLAVFHSDGLSAKWDIDSYPGLATRHPAMIAAVLYRDFKRVRDDNLVVVLKTHDP